MSVFTTNRGAKHARHPSRCQLKPASIVDSLIALLLPATCPACEQTTEHQDGAPFCRTCMRALPILGPQCPRCALPFFGTQSDAGLCGACLAHPPLWQAAWSGFAYRGLIAKTMPALKFHQKLALAPALGRALLELPCPLDFTHIDMLIPAPLHLSRLRARGFNQALELCRPLARSAGLEIRQDLLQRRHATAEQSRLNARQRHHNMREAFACRSALAGEHILLFDDVMTTGATAAAMTRCLMENGASRVSVITLARAL